MNYLYKAVLQAATLHWSACFVVGCCIICANASLAGQALQCIASPGRSSTGILQCSGLGPVVNSAKRLKKCTQAESACLARLCSLRCLRPVMQCSSAPEVFLPVPGCPVQVIKPSHRSVVEIELLMMKVMEVWLGLCLE